MKKNPHTLAWLCLLWATALAANPASRCSGQDPNNNEGGIFDAYAVVNDQFYDLMTATSNPDFVNADLGSFSPINGVLEMSGGEIKTYKNSGTNICGGKIWYAVYPAGGSPGAFAAINLAFHSDLGGGDQIWQTVNGTTNLITGLAPGNYHLAVWVSDWGNPPGGPDCATDPFHVQDNGGAYWVANFSVCDEVFYADTDGDGYGDANATIQDCVAPSGYVDNADDCDDTDANVNPGETEICGNGTDENCNGSDEVSGIGLTLTPDCFFDAYTRVDVDFVSGGILPFEYSMDGITWQDTVGFDSLSAGSYTFYARDADGCVALASQEVAPPMSHTSSQTHVSCFQGTNGTATITFAGGGYGPNYTYSLRRGGNILASGPISPSETVTVYNLGAGNHRFYVDDAQGCSVPGALVQITQPTAININITKTNPLCVDEPSGTATALPSGGVGSYSYEWMNGQFTQTATGLSAATYSVTVTDANGCEKSKFVTLNNPPAINLTVSRTAPTCPGFSNGSATATATGGTGAKTFLWSTGATTPGITGLAAGTYTVTATDANSCDKVFSFTLFDPAFSVNIAKKDITCFGEINGSATATAVGGKGQKTYLWNTGATTRLIAGLPQGSYTVTATDAIGCQVSATVDIVEPPLLLINGVTAVPGSVPGRFTVTVNATGGTPTLRYRRSTPGGVYTNLMVNNVFNNILPGTYSFVVVDSKFCTDTMTAQIPQVFFGGPSAGRASFGAMPDFKLMPNPAHSEVSLVFEGNFPGDGLVEIRDARGVLLRQQTLNSPILQLENLPTGMLFVTWRAAGVAPVTKRLILE